MFDPAMAEAAGGGASGGGGGGGASLSRSYLCVTVFAEVQLTVTYGERMHSSSRYHRL
jgi:hypothetical protein